MPVDRRLSSVLFALVALLLVSRFTVVQAQSTWPPPTVLWRPQPGIELYVNNATNIVTDPAGAVHVAWLNFPATAGNNSDQVAIFYSRWDDKGWVTPVDIFAWTSAVPLGNPVLLPTDDGRLHILWISLGRLMHSVAWADDAARPQSWSEPWPVALVSTGWRTEFDATIDMLGNFHAALVEDLGEAYYTRSDDQGETWSEPTRISYVAAGNMAYLPQLAVSPDGRLHVVWSEGSPDEMARTSHVYYSFSADGGNTWAEPREFGGPSHSDANVAAFAGDRVYVAWQAGTATSGGRYLVYSDDAGVSWSMPLEFSIRAGLSGYPSIISDTLGRVHLLTGDGEYAMWDGAILTPAEPLSPVSIQTERCRLAVSSGNMLVAVFPPDNGIVYGAVRSLDVLAIPTQKPSNGIQVTRQPAETDTPVVAATEPAAISIAPTPSVAQTSGTDLTSIGTSRSGTHAVLLGAAGALLVVLLAVAHRVWQGKR